MEKAVLIVAHGQPSDPTVAEADMAALGARVAALLPGWRVGSATMAAAGRIEAEVARLGAPCVLPFFMADGWFTKVAMPARLARTDLTILPAFGGTRPVASLAAAVAMQGARDQGWLVEETELVLAAHGSGRSQAPAKAATKIAAFIEAHAPFARVRLGFIEEDPLLEDVARGCADKALCLPLFVAHWGHVRDDIPAALSKAEFHGRCLAALGTRPEVPGILAAMISDHHGQAHS